MISTFTAKPSAAARNKAAVSGSAVNRYIEVSDVINRTVGKFSAF
jgi:hypothetical protein